MIKHQLAAMPASKGNSHGREGRQHQAIGQDVLVAIDANAGIGSGNGQHHHGGNGVVPAGDAHANARNGQQFGRAGNGCDGAQTESGASGPQTDLYPEWVGRPPVKNIDAKGGDHEGDWEVDQHGMDGMTRHSDGRGNVLLGHGANVRIGMVAARFDTVFRTGLVGRRVFLGSDFLFFALARLFLQRCAPLFKILLLIGTPVVLAGCSGQLSTLDPAGPRAANLATLWWIMLAGSTLLFGLVMALLAIAYLRTDWVARITPMQWIVGGGLVLPIPILVLLTGTALVLGEQLLPRGETPVRIEAQAQRWAWTFNYGDGAFAQSDVLHMPAGEPVDFVVTSADVIHSFWIPRLGGKIDAIPGHENVIRLEADEPGLYWGQCAEYCGEGHDGMQFRVMAHSAEDFAQLLAGGTP
jgi:cytochrome c oxidase subunit II